MSKKHHNIPIFIPELACPHQCVFCDQKKISGKLTTPGIEEIIKIIETHLETFRNGSEVEIAFFGGNFTGLDLSDQKGYLDLAQKYVDSGRVSGIRMSTRPDYIDERIINFLSQYSLSSIELGAQSFDDDVLKKSGRGHTAADIQRASQMIKDAGISLGLQMMTGLPGSNREKEIYTVKQIIALGAENTRIYPALVIKGTKLEEFYRRGKYKPQTIQEAVDICAVIIQLFENADIKILKLGLHPSEGLLSGEDLIAGPFHPSFRELVLSEIWKRNFENYSFQDAIGCRIEVRPEEINYAVGYSSANKKMLSNIFRNVRFNTSKELKGREFNVIYC